MADGRSLSLISKARKALAEAKTFDEFLSIRDQAEAVRQLMKIQGHSLEMQNEAAEIKIQAERKLGEAISAIDKKVNRHSSGTTLVQLEISRNQSSRWQLTASLPEEEFARLVSETKECQRELTSTSVRRAAKQFASKSEPQPPSKPNPKQKDQPAEPLAAAILKLDEFLNGASEWWPEGLLGILGDKLIEYGNRILSNGVDR